MRLLWHQLEELKPGEGDEEGEAEEAKEEREGEEEPLRSSWTDLMCGNAPVWKQSGPQEKLVAVDEVRVSKVEEGERGAKVSVIKEEEEVELSSRLDPQDVPNGKVDKTFGKMTRMTSRM